MGAVDTSERVDLVVIGGGPGGYVAAIRASQLGMRVVLVERASLGGVCLNWGCIPTKAILRSADVLATVREAERFGVGVTGVQVDYPQVIRRSREIAGRLSAGVALLMKKNRIRTVQGRGRLVDPHTVEVTYEDGSTGSVPASNILIATGARTRELPGMEVDGETVIGSRGALELDRIPESVAIVGAGAIGVEFAHIYQAFGAQVTLIELLPAVLPLADQDVSKELTRVFKRRKMTVLTGARVQSLTRTQTGAALTVSRNGKEQVVEVERVLIAAGVRPNIEGLGLDELGIDVSAGAVKVDQSYRTGVRSVYAVGDVIGEPCLAHAASAEGVRAVEIMAGLEITPLDYTTVPTCVYCNPQVASVGYTEQGAMDAGYAVKVGRFPLRASGKALALGELGGFVKMVVDGKCGEILGCHIVGAEATELIAEVTLARTAGMTCREVLATVHPHPTLSEAIHEAAGDALGEALNL